MKTIAVIGAGRIGLGITYIFAFNNYNVYLFDHREPEKKLREYQKKLVNVNPKTEQLKKAISALSNQVKIVNSIDDIAFCDLAIEAVTEDYTEKINVLRKLGENLRENIGIATTTAAFSINELGKAACLGKRFFGLKFFPPVPLIDLVEIVPGPMTKDFYIDCIKTTLSKMRRTFIISPDTPGFTVNRQIIPTWNEAFYLLKEGVSAEDIDQAMRLATEAPLGPLQLADYIGLDLVLHVMTILQHELDEEKYVPCPLLVQYVSQGRLGRKTGRGVYTYEAE